MSERPDGEQPRPDRAGGRPARRRLDPAGAVAEQGSSLASAGSPSAPASPSPDGPPSPSPDGPRSPSPDGPPQRPQIDTRRYQWTIGLIGLTLVIAFSVYLYVRNGIVEPGIPAGGQLHRFVAPLAASRINRPANANPRCDPARPNPRALNVCGRKPLVLDFFVTGAGQCVREVSTLQRLAARFPRVVFAAVAVRAGPAATSALVSSHHWTIPVAYDEDGRIGAIYGVEVCPMIELARPGGKIVARLVGDRWLDERQLAGQVQRLSAGGVGVR